MICRTLLRVCGTQILTDFTGFAASHMLIANKFYFVTNYLLCTTALNKLVGCCGNYLDNPHRIADVRPQPDLPRMHIGRQSVPHATNRMWKKIGVGSRKYA